MTNSKEIASSIKNEIEAICNEAQIVESKGSKPTKTVQKRLDRIPKKMNVILPKTNIKLTVRATANKECIQSDVQHNVKHKPIRLPIKTNKQTKITKTKHSTHKTPAQQRLNDLRKELIKEQSVSSSAGKEISHSQCDEKLQKPTAILSASTTSVATENIQNESKDLTHSVPDAGLIDVDIELTLIQNREFFFLLLFC